MFSAGHSNAPDAGEGNLIKVASLDTIKSNQEFQRNVQVVRTAYQSVIDLKAKIAEEADAIKKVELEVKLEAAAADVNKKNQKMVKAYGFSLQRNYVLVVERSHIYMRVTNEEAALFKKQLEEAQAAAEGNENE